VIVQRVISALCIAALLVAAVYLLPAVWSLAALTLVLLAAAWEWSGFLKPATLGRRSAFMVTCTLVAAFWWWLVQRYDQSLSVVVLATAFWTLAALWLIFAPSRVSNSVVFVGGVLALSLAWVAVADLRLRGD
jgi:phosphatidate cytidylyltransferase